MDSKTSVKLEILEYISSYGKNIFRNWLGSLDTKVRARIQARLFRIETGNLGEYKSLGKAYLNSDLILDLDTESIIVVLRKEQYCFYWVEQRKHRRRILRKRTVNV
jgi:hypothetical protein